VFEYLVGHVRVTYASHEVMIKQTSNKMDVEYVLQPTACMACRCGFNLAFRGNMTLRLRLGSSGGAVGSFVSIPSMFGSSCILDVVKCMFIRRIVG